MSYALFSMNKKSPGIEGEPLKCGISITDMTDSVYECSDGDFATRLLSYPAKRCMNIPSKSASQLEGIQLLLFKQNYKNKVTDHVPQKIFY